MLSLISSLFSAQRIPLAGKVFRSALFSVFCALVIAPSLPAQAQSFQAGIGAAGDFFFKINISSMPQNTDTITIHVWHGGRKIIGPSSYQVTKSNAPFIIRVGNLWDSNFDPSRSKINPSTTYDVRVEAIRGMQSLGSQSFTVTTAAERICHKLGGASSYQNCPKITIHSQNHSATALEFIINKVSGASYYKLPSNVAAKLQGAGCEESRDSTLGPMIKWWPKNRFADPSTGGKTFLDQHMVRYCGLRPNTQFNIPIVAYGSAGMPNQYYVIAYGEVSVSTLAENTGSGSPQQLAPPPTPSPTAIPPLAIQVDYYGNHDTAVTLSWDAPGGYPAGYVLQVVGGNNEGYVFHLGRKETSQRVNGLTPGADYTAYLTAYLRDGGKRSGEAHFGMADPPPTSTPIPPTATPIPQQSSQDSVQDQSPPQLQYSPMQAEEDEEDEPQPSGPYASLIADILVYRAEQGETSDHYIRWTRALAALWDAVSHNNPMTLSEAQGYLSRGWTRWQPVVDALTALNPPTNTPIPPPPPTPIPPTPVPPTPIPPTPVPPTPVPPQQESYKAPQSLIDDIRSWRSEQAPTSDHAIRWTRVLAAFGKASHSNPMSSSEAKIYRDERGWSRWIDVVTALEKLGK